MKIRIQNLMAIALIFFGVNAVDLSANSRVIYVRKAPPARKRGIVKPAKPKYKVLWVDGNRYWDGKAYIWKNGGWVNARKNQKRVLGHLKKSPRGHIWIDGHWKRR